MAMFTKRQNKSNTTGFKDVYKNHKGYIKRICVNGQHYRGPKRATKDEAYHDRPKMEEKYRPKLDTKKE